MITNSKSPIEKMVDRLFVEMNAKRGDLCVNPVTSGHFVWGDDPLAPQKREAVAALRAREWFAVNGPADAPPLPISYNEVERYREARGLAGIVGFFARSLSRQDYDVLKHPSFDDFARGLMASNTNAWGIEKDEHLKKRFPPRPLKGMSPGCYWAPPKEYA